MAKIKTIKLTIPQRNGLDKPIKVTIRRYPVLIAKTAKASKTKSKESSDYGISEEQFESILEKAAQPINKKHRNQ